MFHEAIVYPGLHPRRSWLSTVSLSWFRETPVDAHCHVTIPTIHVSDVNIFLTNEIVFVQSKFCVGSKRVCLPTLPLSLYSLAIVMWRLRWHWVLWSHALYLWSYVCVLCQRSVECCWTRLHFSTLLYSRTWTGAATPSPFLLPFPRPTPGTDWSSGRSALQISNVVSQNRASASPHQRLGLLLREKKSLYLLILFYWRESENYVWKWLAFHIVFVFIVL